MFPLEGALLPNQDLPLRIFEPRYGALAQHCIATGEPFGVVLISQGREVGGGESRYDVGTLTRIVEYAEQGAGRYTLRCRTGERIKVLDWLPDDPYPRATVRVWPDEPGDDVTEAQLLDVEDRVMALFERIAAVRGVELPGRDVVLGMADTDSDTESAGERLYALASHIPIGSADRYAVLAAPSAAARLIALREAVESLAEMVEFQLSE
jgi:uncharacterized protein